MLEAKRWVGVCWVLFAISCGAAQAQEVAVSDPWVRGTVAAQKATGAFMELRSKDDAFLVSAASPVAATVEIHEMVLEHDIMKMRPIPRLDLPAGKPVALKPGGYHVMLMDLRQPLRKGESVPITLKVEGKDKSIRTVEVQAEVRDLTTPGHDSHSKH
jgi:hypothetical protein